MNMSRRALLGTAAALPALGATRTARAQRTTLRIGVLTDMSGPYKDIGGPLAVEAVRLAVADSGIAEAGVNVEVLFADHQNKPDVGSNIARQWYDRDGVDMVTEGGSSAVALAVAGVSKDKNKTYLTSGPASSDITGRACNANTIHWTYDTYMLAKSTGAAMVKAGGDSWFFITADYAFGHALSRDVGGFVTGAGGRVLGNVRTPFPGTTDFSSFLLQAQASGAKVIGLANAGTDTINCIKQAKEFGIKSTLAGLLVFISDVHALGLEVAGGLALTESFYWDLNDRTRGFSERLWRRMPGVRAGMVQAGPYSAAFNYLRAARQMGAAEIKKDGAATIAHLKKTPADDDVFGPSTIREDGRKLNTAYLFQVKTPAESKGAWDYYKLVGSTPGPEAFRPMSEGGCPLVKT
jgi:branched-chain amino acid transport system substrate-binding protein